MTESSEIAAIGVNVNADDLWIFLRDAGVGAKRVHQMRERARNRSLESGKIPLRDIGHVIGDPEIEQLFMQTQASGGQSLAHLACDCD